MGQKGNISIPQLPRPGEVLEDRYELAEAFASGGMGVVMRATQMRTGRDVAVKLLHPHIASRPGFAERFQREVQVATLFDHPHIMRVYDVGQTAEGVLYLVMELLEGRELEALIKAEAPLSIGRAGAIATQMLDGLAEAHAQNVIHRDFKPSNVFVSTTRRGADHVKLLDFGIAKVIDSDDHQLTSTGSITGTPAYMAPEMLLSKGQRNKKSVDVYAAGLVFLEMLTGQKAFHGEDMPQTLLMQLKQPVRIPSLFSSTPLGEFIRRSTAKHPADRYGDADEMHAALERVLDQVDPDLRLEDTRAPGLPSLTPMSNLASLADGPDDNSLEMLRRAPQHETYDPDATLHTPPPRPATPSRPPSTPHIAPPVAARAPVAERRPPSPPPLPKSAPKGAPSEAPSPPVAALNTLVVDDDQKPVEPTLTPPPIANPAPAPSKNPKVALLAAGGAVLLLVVVGAAVIGLTSADPAAEPSDDPATPTERPTPDDQAAVAPEPDVEERDASEPEPEPALVDFTIITIPPDADIVRDGAKIGVAGEPIELSAEQLPVTLELRKAGFISAQAVLDDPQQTTHTVELDPEPRPTTPPRASERRPTPRRTPKKPRKPTPEPEKTESVDSIVDEYL